MKSLKNILLLFFSIFFLLITVPSNADLSPEKTYEIAKRRYHKLMTSSPMEKINRQSWDRTIGLFKEVFNKNPRGSLADDSLFSIGSLYAELYRRAGNKDDLKNAVKYYQKVYQKFPKSNLSDDSLFLIGEAFFLYEKDYSSADSAYRKIVNNYPKGDKYTSAKIRLREIKQFYSNKASLEKKEGLSQIKGVRHWSNPKYTRIVIDLNNKVTYKESQLRNPDRIYLDLLNTRLGPEAKKHFIKIGDSLLKSIRLSHHTAEITRVVIDINNINRYKIFVLENPFRIVIDVKGNYVKDEVVAEKRKKEDALPRKKREELTVKHYIKTIVIDPGHGGKDPGAIGYNGLEEKTVVLDIAKRLKKIMREKTNYKIILTREKDVYLSLEERTAIANTLNADLFISLHANASRRRGAMGVETYFLDYTFNEEVLEIASRENNAPFLLKDDLQAILYDLKKTNYYNESILLANHVQESLILSLDSNYRKFLNRGAKAAPFYVLFGAEMPSVLIETLFISNRKEEKMLRNERFKQRIAEAIFIGIQNYMSETKKDIRAVR
jgi:N-acetylmuramoyl-L-alanine amidase